MRRNPGLDGRPIAARVNSRWGPHSRFCASEPGPDGTWNWTTLNNMARLLYHEAPPEPGLAHAVDCLWSVSISPDGTGKPSHWVLPDGCHSLAVRVKRAW